MWHPKANCFLSGNSTWRRSASRPRPLRGSRRNMAMNVPQRLFTKRIRKRMQSKCFACIAKAIPIFFLMSMWMASASAGLARKKQWKREQPSASRWHTNCISPQMENSELASKCALLWNSAMSTRDIQRKKFWLCWSVSRRLLPNAAALVGAEDCAIPAIPTSIWMGRASWHSQKHHVGQNVQRWPMRFERSVICGERNPERLREIADKQKKTSGG